MVKGRETHQLPEPFGRLGIGSGQGVKASKARLEGNDHHNGRNGSHHGRNQPLLKILGNEFFHLTTPVEHDFGPRAGYSPASPLTKIKPLQQFRSK